MREHFYFKIDWVGFPKTHRKVKGCYLIGNVYVGASKHIRARVLQHLREVYSVTDSEFTHTYDSSNPKPKLDYLFARILFKEPIRVEYISDNTNDEEDMHLKYNIPIKKLTRFYPKN